MVLMTTFLDVVLNVDNKLNIKVRRYAIINFYYISLTISNYIIFILGGTDDDVRNPFIADCHWHRLSHGDSVYSSNDIPRDWPFW